MPFLTDRTRITTYQTCPRLRFLTFQFGGRGLVPMEAAYELQFGISYHDTISALLQASVTPEDPDPDTRLIGRASAFLEELAVPPGAHPLWRTEQRYLIEGLLWAWVLTRRDRWRDQYELVMSEREFLWRMSDDLAMMVRLDQLMRDRVTGDLYYVEHKTTAWGNERWSDTFTHNAQVMAGILACEQALQEMPAGVLLEGHVKGPRRTDTAYTSEVSGFTFQDSPLCYMWQLPNGTLTQKWKSGCRRVSAWSTGASPRAWVEEVLTSLERENCFRTLPPILPDRLHLARWLRQTVLQEKRIEATLRLLGDTDPLAMRTLLDSTFPLHEGSCEWQYGRRCSHWVFCHDQTTAAAPLDTPGFVTRTPHHAAELQEEPRE